MIMRVLDCYLALCIRTEERNVAIASSERCCAGQPMGNSDRERHKLICFVDSVSDHYSLITCTLVQVRYAYRRANVW